MVEVHQEAHRSEAQEVVLDLARGPGGNLIVVVQAQADCHREHEVEAQDGPVQQAQTRREIELPLNAELRLGWVATLELLKQATLSACFILFVLIGGGLVDFFWASVIAGKKPRHIWSS